MKIQHWLVCEAPLCADERGYVDILNWRKDVIWYPGELICQRKPFTKWQKRQSLINRWFAKGQFKYGDTRYFNVEMLIKGNSVRKGRRGGDPNKKTWDKEYLEALKTIKINDKKQSTALLGKHER